MSTAAPIGDGRYRHRESMPFTRAAPRARHLDAAGVQRVIDREVRKGLGALDGFEAKLDDARRQIDAINATNADTAAKLVSVKAALAMRDAVKRYARTPTPYKINAANYARQGRDAEGRWLGDVGFGLTDAAMRDATAEAASPAAAINAMNRKVWGRA